MAELERELRELGALVEFPPAPDLAGAVRERLARVPQRPRFGRRRALVLAFAVVAVAVAAAMAVPQARTAILEWLGLRGVAIERVPTLPTIPAEEDLGLGVRVSLAEARERAAYPVLVPSVEGLSDPQEVYFTFTGPGGQVAFLYRGGGRRLLITQFRASLRDEYIEKSAGPDTVIERVNVEGEPGWWLTGEPHAFMYVDGDGTIREESLRLAGNTLLWESEGRTLRLEGASTLREAIRIAESMR